MGGVLVCDKVCLGVVSTSSFPPVTRVHLPWLMKLPGRGFMTIGSFWGICLQADKGVQRKTLPALLFSKCQQPPVINIHKQPILTWYILNTHIHILG